MTTDDEAVEAVARAIQPFLTAISRGDSPTALLYPAAHEALAAARVRSRPGSEAERLLAEVSHMAQFIPPGLAERVDAYLSRVPSPGSGTEPDTAKLVEALRLIAEHARLDESERGIAEAARYYGIAADALAGFSVDAGKPGPGRTPGGNLICLCGQQNRTYCSHAEGDCPWWDREPQDATWRKADPDGR